MTPLDFDPTAERRPRRRMLMPLLCAVLLALAAWWSHTLTFDSAAWPGQRLSDASACVCGADADTPPDAAAGWQRTTLPDNWKLSHPQGPGTIWYRIPFDRAGLREPAVLVPRLATGGQVFLNGSRLWENRSRAEGETRSWNAPVLLMLPDGLLRERGNVLEVQVSGLPRYRAGLSHVQLAEQALLRPIAARRLFWQHDAALLSATVALVGGGLMLLTWVRLRSTPMYLYYALATLAWAARNSNLYLDSLPVSVDAWAVIVHSGHCWFATFFGLFVLRFTETHWPRLEWALWAFGALNTGLMLGGGFSTIEHVLRWTSAPGFALFFVLVGLLLRKGWRDADAESALLAATTLTFLGLTLRDALLLASRLPYEAYYLSHYTGVLMLVLTAWSLVSRKVAALQAVQTLNADLERRVGERTRELQQANGAKSRFLASASHDLRQPVAAIGLLIGLLRERITEPALRAMAQRVDEAVASLEGLLAGLLDLSRLDSGTLEPRLRTVALQPLFDAIAAHEAEAAQRKGLSLRIRATELAVHSDPLLLEQILRNFVSNALRYTDRGGVLLAARRAGPGKVRLQVWDTGRGIAAEQQSAVFEEFVQLDNPQRDRRQGLGLGLAIVRRSAALLGAPLVLNSRPGRGSCFDLSVPLAAGHAAPSAEPEPPEPLLQGATVVLVEDDETVREALRARLAAWGAQVRAFDGPQALRVALDAQAPDSRRADLIVTDQRLPGGSGLDVIRLARRHYGALPALVVTGDTSPQDIARLAASGARVLHKPFRAEQLHAAIADLLRP